MKISSIEHVEAPRSYEDVLSEIDPKTMDFDDMNVMKTVFWDGNMTGIFQVTSGGMVKLFKQVKPSCFKDVAATAALFRPGPLGSKMDQMYANRKNGLEEVSYEHPLLEEILGETYGVYVYQEQILELCRRVALMSWKDTNRVRKLRLKKDKSKSAEFIAKEEAELKELFVSGLVKTGLSEARGEQLWKDLEAWGSYGFNSFTGSTLVKVSRDGEISDIQIVEIKPGDLVLSRDEKSGDLIWIQVLTLWEHGKEETYRFLLDDGSSVDCTMNHKFRVTDGRMVPMGEILQQGLEIVALTAG